MTPPYLNLWDKGIAFIEHSILQVEHSILQALHLEEVSILFL
jgi:hypothetical protein